MRDATFLPVLQTPAIASQPNLYGAIVVNGHVIGPDGRPDFPAVVEVTKAGGSTVWSAQTNALGNYSITASDVSLLDQATITVRSETGTGTLTVSVLAAAQEIPTISVKAYE